MEGDTNMGVYQKIAAAALASVAAVSMPSIAGAATFLTFSGTSGVYGNSNNSQTPFTDTFTVPTGKGWLSATISSIGQGVSNIDFTSVTLNGTAFTPVSTGFTEFRKIVRLPVAAGNQIIQVAGISGRDASYDGTLAFAAVPDPTTWALMILGFGAVGYGLRRRAAARLRVSFG